MQGKMFIGNRKALKEQIRHQKRLCLVAKIRTGRAASPLLAVRQHAGQQKERRHMEGIYKFLCQHVRDNNVPRICIVQNMPDHDQCDQQRFRRIQIGDSLFHGALFRLFSYRHKEFCGSTM